ncbi:unnamed protein product [Camellia sinensis]
MQPFHTVSLSLCLSLCLSLSLSNMAKSQNSKFTCFSGIFRCLLCIGSLPTQPSDPTTDIPTTTTTFENPKKNFKTQVKTPGVVARLMGLNSLLDPRKVFRRKEDQKEKIHVYGRPPNVIARLMGLDGLPPQQPLHREHKGFSETYRQWTALVSPQRDGKPYEHRSNRKDSMASSYPAKRTINSKRSKAEMAFIQQKFMADHDRILSKLGEATFGQVLECLDNENLEHLAMTERLLGPLPQHMIISAILRAEKYFKRSPRLDWLEGASSKESTRAVWKLPRLQCRILSKMGEGTFGQVLECLDHENLEHLAMMKRLLGPLPQHMIISANLRAEKYFKRSPRLDWLEGASSKESTRAVWKLPRLQCFSARLMGLDGLPPQQPPHRQHKGFSETYRQWTTSVSSQRDGKPYEHRSNRKDSMAQQECKDEYEVLETSKVERSSYPAKRTINSKLSEAEMAFIQQKFMADHGRILSKMGEGTFGQVLECLDHENLEHLAMMKRLLGPLPQHMIISANLRAEKYFKRSACLDWLEGASSNESTRPVWKLPRLQYLKLGHLKKRRFSCNVQYLNHNLQQAQKRLIIRSMLIFTGFKLLIKMESKANADGLMLTPSDKDVGQGFVSVSEDNEVFNHESWESVYLANVLIDSRYDDADPDTFLSTWYSLNCPLDPCLFDNVEEKYSNKTTSSRFERKLLFDRINYGLFEIFHQFKHGISYELHKLLASEEKSMHKDVIERVLDREMQWLDSGDGVDAIGAKFEKLLMDDLIVRLHMLSMD